jgi:hypothetical protein
MLGVVFVIMLRFRSEALSATVVALDAVQDGIGKIADSLRVISSPKPTPDLGGELSATTCTSPQFVYLTDEGVMHHCQGTGQFELIAPADPNKIWFYTPTFVDQDTISYVECFSPEAELGGSKPYSCSLIVYDLLTEQSEKLVSYQSFYTGTAHIGAEIFDHGWNSTGTQVVYLHQAYEQNPASQFGSSATVVSLYDTRTRASKVIGSLVMPAGRGGATDDEVKVVFSPDDTKVLVQAHGLTSREIVESAKEVILLGVFDVYGNQTTAPLWHEPTEWTTFGSFVSPNQLIAKQLNSGEEPDVLISIDIPTRTKTELRSAEGWYGVNALSPEQILYWSVEAETMMPEVSIVDLTTSTEVKNWPGVQLLKFLTPTTALAATYESCPLCETGMGALSGVKQTATGLLNLKTGEFTSLKIDNFRQPLSLDAYLP